MRQLHAGNSTLRLNELKNPRQHFDVRIFPNPEVLRTDPSLGQNCGRLGENERRAADRAAAKVHEVPVVREAISLEYWHIGETTMRLRRLTSRSRSGENK